MRNGILLIDKAPGVTSAGVVARVKRMLGADRVGHAGTLDPDATGLLILLLQGATRVASYAADGYKVYSGEMRLGVTTSTDDLAGEVLSSSDDPVEWSAVVSAAERLTGFISQVPPKVSAIKVNGKRAHKLHRQGESFELSARQVHVRRFEVTRGTSVRDVRYVVECSPGTYVRSLARDLGVILGCGASVGSIRRERSGHFRVEDAVRLENVSWDRVRDWSELVPEMPRVTLSSEVAASLLNGQRFGLQRAFQEWEASGKREEAEHVVFASVDGGESLGILRVGEGRCFEFELNIPPRSKC